MTHYDQAMKHWGNHRKDGFTQPCGFTATAIEEPHFTEDQERQHEMETMFTILKENHEFPVFVYEDKFGFYGIVPSNHLFGEKLDNQEALVDFAVKYVYGYVPFEQFRDWAVSEAFKMNREAGDEREYTQSDYESASWAVAGIYARSGVAGCINYLLNYKYTPRKKIARGYC